jgi:acetyl-CoA carboxylase biotin carboxyl carrier protein
MDYQGIEKLIQTMSNSPLSSLEIEWDGVFIKMKKENEVVNTPRIKTPVTVEKMEEKLSVQKEVTNKEDGYIVTSPIVGTFYTASSPEANPFVSVGTKVKKGDVLCIIEAMKLMNDIESEVDGTIVEILVENEQMIEYGQPLFKIQKSEG